MSRFIEDNISASTIEELDMKCATLGHYYSYFWSVWVVNISGVTLICSQCSRVVHEIVHHRYFPLVTFWTPLPFKEGKQLILVPM